MRSSLTLPLPTRHGDIPYVPIIHDLEPVVETVASTQQISFSTMPLNVDMDLNSVIIEAQFNAEANRRMSMDNLDEIDGHSPLHVRERRRDKSISFGNESEIEYNQEDAGVLLQGRVRSSKDFDGNRSGRPSAKQ